MGNRNHRALLLIENDAAEIAAASGALDRAWTRVQSLARKPVLTLDALDGLCVELRAIEPGLAAGRRALQQLREEL